MPPFTNTPRPPYFAVIFTSTLTPHAAGYDDMAQKMVALAAQQSGFLGMESARDSVGMTVSYWSSLEAIKQWKAQADHLVAQQLGQARWYEHYCVRIAKVERDYRM